MPASLLTNGPPNSARAKPVLPSVTLVAATSISLPATVAALARSIEQVEFGAALLLSDRPPDTCPSGIEWRYIRPIASRAEYSIFILQELGQHIDTDFALCVQWDSFVLDGARWQPSFLNYDYIGAPWPHFHDEYRVGNGGFSLRSKRLLEASAKLPASIGDAEDIAICRTYRRWLEQQEGIRFAPEPVARSFAFERTPPNGTEFGFHGIFNMRSILGGSNFAPLLASLDPGTIGRREAREIFWQSLARADVRSARLALRNSLKRT